MKQIDIDSTEVGSYRLDADKAFLQSDFLLGKSDNINYRHFLNYTWLSDQIPERIPTDEELFGKYLKKWESASV